MRGFRRLIRLSSVDVSLVWFGTFPGVKMQAFMDELALIPSWSSLGVLLDIRCACAV